MRYGMQRIGTGRGTLPMRGYRSLVGLLVLALLAALMPTGLQQANAAGGNASIDLSKTITATTLTPALSLAFAVDHASAIPGDPLTYTATISNTGTNLGLTGAFIARNNGDVAATVAAYYDYVEYFSVTENRWVPLAGTAATQPGYTPLEAAPIQSGLTLVATAVPTTGVTYPTSGDPILGTALALGRTASWTYRATIALTPAQLSLLLDPARVSGIRNVVHFEVTPRAVRLGQPYKYQVDFITPLQTQSGTATNAVITIAPPTGPPVRFDSTTTPALASLAPGTSVTVQTNYPVPVLAPKGATETDAAYLAHLRAADNAILTATADASATSNGATITLPQATARRTEHLPVLTIHKSGPSQLDAGSTATYDLALANSGSAPASALAIADTLSNGASATVSDVPSTLTAAATATAHASYAVPQQQSSGTLTDTASLTWRDANGNTYGPLADSFATAIRVVGQGGTLTLAPESAGPNVTGTTQTLTASARNADGTAIANLSVHFTVTGANPTSGDALTDASGTATFSYQGANYGEDTVSATATAGGNTLTSNSATVFWITPVQPVATTTVWARFFTNPRGSVVFDKLLSDTPVFTQTFPTLNFNPVSGSVPGAPAGLNQDTRPFTNVTTDLNGDYTGSIVAQGNGYVAGLGSLTGFEAVFTGAFVVKEASTLTLTMYSDDGYNWGVGPDKDGHQPHGSGSSSAVTLYNHFPVLNTNNGQWGYSTVTVTFPAPGMYPYEINFAENGPGGVSFSVLTAASGNHGVPPSGSLTISPNSVASKPAGQPQSFTVTATNASGVALTNLPVTLAVTGPNGQQLSAITDAAGRTSFSYTGANVGTDTVQAIAWVSGIATYSAQVSVPWTAGAPPAPSAPLAVPGWLGSPANQSTVSGQVPIRLASGITLQNGMIDYWPADDLSAVTVLATNVSGSGGATLATLDTTLLANGSYIIRLQGTNSSGVQVNSGVLITVTGENKPGRVRFAVTDLTVPVTGLPITIGRTYDSLERGRSGDFGYGWSLSVGSPRLKVDQANNVTLTQPNGRRVTFYFRPRSVGGIFGFLLIPAYTPEPGVYGSLTADGCGLMVVSGGSYMCFLDDPVYHPTTYTYTDPYGRVTTMGADGSLRTITDLNGNTLTFNANGITSSTGNLNVPFVRDGQGRITQITDPLGNVYRYGYDTAGNLASVMLPGTTNLVTYSYDASHFFLSAVDPRGNTAITTSYYPNGRLQSETDAVGNTTQYVYDLSTNTTRITNPDGGITTSRYDSYGMPVSETDPLGRTTSYTYDSNHNKLSQTDGAGHITTYVYDNSGHQISVTNPLGKSTLYTYNQYGGPTSQTDALGNRQSFTYDSSFLPTNASDSLGILSSFSFDSHANLLTRTDANGKTTTYTYDIYGNKRSETDPEGHTTSYTYDQSGRPLTKTDSLGNTTHYQYDALGHVLTESDPQGHITSYEYDANGNMKARMDPLGRRTSYTYDAANQLTTITYPDGTTEHFAYDFRGNRITETDQAGHTTRYQYDLAGQLIRRTDAEGTADASTVDYAYDAVGRKVSEIDALGHISLYRYDAAGQLLSISNALSQTTTYTYDDAGRHSSSIDANGHQTSYSYDVRGRLTVTTYSDGTTNQRRYDGEGYLSSSIDQAGNRTIYTYDGVGRLASVTDALSQTTSYRYDSTGNLLTITDANSHITSFEYDSLHHRTKRILPLGMRETDTYDAAGNRISKTDFNGKTTTYTYDALDRLIHKTPDSSLGQPPVHFSYTPTGQRATMVDASGTTTYTYDSHDRLIRKATPQGTLTYTYDAAGNLSTMRSSNVDGASVNYTYDALNRLATVVDNRLTTGTTTYSYDAAGNLEGYSYPNGVESIYTYNSVNQLTDLAVSKTAPLARYRYTLGPAGNRLAIAELSGRTVNYTYDALYRLTSETISSDPAGNNGAIGYTYDSVGNRLTRTSTVTVIPAATYHYDSNNRQASATYDDNGNTIAAEGKTYAYDFEDRLTSVNGGTTAIVYDGDGNRVAETVGGVTTQYLIDDRNPTGYPQVVEEIAGGSVQRVYTYGHDLISQSQLRAGTWIASFYGYDGLGSVRMLTDSQGAITDRYDYDAFGNHIASVGNTPNTYLFTGEQLDPNVGFYYLRARYYDPQQGRFISLDPYQGRIFEPISLHKYLYAEADPVDTTDPSGLQAIATYSLQLKIEIDLTYPAAVALGLAVACLFTLTAQQLGAPLTGPCTLYRGAIQIQGGDISAPGGTLSFPWARQQPLTAAEGLAELAALWSSLTPKQQARRTQAYTKAVSYISRCAAAAGCLPPGQSGFQNYPVPRDYPDARIDVAIFQGRNLI